MTLSGHRLPLTNEALAEPFDLGQTGAPSTDAIHEILPFTPRPGGPTYRILRTVEFDTYETSPTRTAVTDLLASGAVAPSAIARALRTPPPAGDTFAGTARKAAKLSIGSGATEVFVDVAALVASLPADATMVHHQPVIQTTSDSGRVAEEQRNVRVTGFLYAASREADNDFHLIIGRAPSATPETYMTMEVSGLPPTSYPAFAHLKAARDAFTTYFGTHLPQLSYDYYQPPIPVVIEGSLFFDMTHATGQAPGPPSLKSRMPTIWEVHPVTSITFEPAATPPGQPAAASITGQEPFTSPRGEQYTIIHTAETDAQPAIPTP